MLNLDEEKKAKFKLALLEYHMAMEESSSSSSSSGGEEDDEFDREIEEAILAHFDISIGKTNLPDSPKLPKVHRVEEFINNVIDQYTDDEFVDRFRMTRSTVGKLYKRFEASHTCPTRRCKGGRIEVPKITYIYIILWFLGGKSTYRHIAVLFKLSVATVARSIYVMLKFFSEHVNEFIRFPETAEEKEHTAAEFEKIAGFPDVLGCIDETYIRINTPAHKLKTAYMAKFGHEESTTITVQAVCDAEGKFLDVFSGPPSILHNAGVFRLSSISKEMKTHCEDNYHILGHGAYPIREWLLTPFEQFWPETSEELYNEKFSHTRIIIGKTFDRLKYRFLQLTQLHCQTEDRVAKIIIACCSLHNMCIEENDHELEFPTLEEERLQVERPEPVEENEDGAFLKTMGEIKRTAIASEIYKKYNI